MKRARHTGTRPAARTRTPLVRGAVLVLLASWVAFFGIWDLQFTNYDDPDYVTSNPGVAEGLTPEGIGWALTTGHAANWHPATWISHMVDVSAFGMDPAGHHTTNLLLHSIAAVLLFLALAITTGATGRSLLVALLFAVHPLQVETVAWVSSRKGLLSAVFALAALLAYARAARGGSRRSWIAVHVLFALSLMAKPMMVTWPFVLLLLDRWPLRRSDPWRRLVTEKAGLFLLAAATSVITVLVQRSGGAVANLESIPLDARLVNATVAFARYLGKLVWPWPLAAPYPHPFLSPGWGSWSGGAVLSSAGLLLGVLGFTAWVARRRDWPWWPVGILWFSGMLVPVIGLVHVGNQAMADRYMYLPSIGFFIAIVWLGAHLAPRPGRPLLGAMAIALCVLAVLTQRQMRVWTDSTSLFEHATRHTRDNWLAWNNLGLGHRETGRQEDALRAFEASLVARPDYVDAQFNRANTLASLDRLEDAEAGYRRALAIEPDHTGALTNLGQVLLRMGRPADALPVVERAAALAPENVSARINLAATLAAAGDRARALQVVAEALRDFPRSGARERAILQDIRRSLQ